MKRGAKMVRRGDPTVLRLVAGFLRQMVDTSQAGFGEAVGVDQAAISRFESGDQPPSEEVLQRMAAVARVPWRVVVHLRPIFAAVVSARARASSAGAGATRLERALLDFARLAVAPLLLAPGESPRHRTPEEARREAEEVWAALAPFPPRERRRLLGLARRASRSWALAVRLCEASRRAAADKAKEALELAELALWIAERVDEEEGFRRRLRGYCLHYLANARRVATDFDGAREASARGGELWRSGLDTDPPLLEEWRLFSLEASLRREEHRFAEALDLLDRARAASGGNPT